MRKKKILIIDDDPNITELTKVLLESHDYKVSVASSAKEGVKKAKRETPNLIVLDIMMPNVDGIKVCKTLKENKKTKNIPIIILTVKWLGEDKKKGLEAGASYYMTKPFEIDELLKKIEGLIK